MQQYAETPETRRLMVDHFRTGLGDALNERLHDAGVDVEQIVTSHACKTTNSGTAISSKHFTSTTLFGNVALLYLAYQVRASVQAAFQTSTIESPLTVIKPFH